MLLGWPCTVGFYNNEAEVAQIYNADMVIVGDRSKKESVVRCRNGQKGLQTYLEPTEEVQRGSL